MRSDAAHLRFLHSARRRWIAWRVLESAGLGAVAIGTLGMMPVGVLVWRGEDAILPAIILLTIGAACGAVWGAMHRPTLAQASIRADQQLGLHDLLGTALTARGCRDEAFRNLVLAQADAVCRDRSASEIIVRRLSGRAWGAIGIALSLLLTISMMSSNPVEIAGAQIDIRTEGDTTLNIKGRVPFSSSNEPEQRLMTRAADPAGAGGKAGAPAADEQDADRSLSNDPGSTGRGANHQNLAIDASGESEARSAIARVDRAERTQFHSPSDTSPNGTLAATGGHDIAAREGSSGETLPPAARGAAAPVQTPPWENPTDGLRDRDRAAQEIRSGRVPDAYRDVVREYFEVSK